jgi:hypothetical protein
MSAMEAKNGDAPVTATLSTSGGSATGLLLEMGSRTVGLLFTSGELSRAALGDRATLSIVIDDAGGEHSAEGHLLSINDDERGRKITIRYSDVADYEALMTTGVGKRFNRRTTFRVEPEPERPVPVVITVADGGELQGRAMDLSATGMALVVTGDMDLTSGQTLELRFSVPWDPKPLYFVGRVCYCGMRDGEMRYGVDFVPHQTPDFEDIQDRLVDYVMTRQREILRRATQAAGTPESS